MINITNLKRAREYVDKHVDADKMSMESYRTGGDNYNPVCKSPGCIIGYTTALDESNVLANFTALHSGFIEFTFWSYYFYFNAPGLFLNDKDGDMWNFLFDGDWINSKAHALTRMDYVIEHSASPEDWDYEWQSENEEVK